MRLVGSGGQQRCDHLYDASGSLAGSSAQLILAQSRSRSFLQIQNLAATDMWLEFGSARATCSLTSGVVTTVTVSNAGFGFTLPPQVMFLGGGTDADGIFLGGNQPNYDSPQAISGGRPAQAHATLNAGTVNAIVIDDGGAGYKIAPFVFLLNDPNDPYGCAAPTSGTGVLLVRSGGSLTFNGTNCPTDPIAVIGTKDAVFTCKWMD